MYGSFYPMKPKAEFFGTIHSVNSTSSSDFDIWEQFFSGADSIKYHGTNYWPKIQERYAGKYQRTFLLALTIGGTTPYKWGRDIFCDLYNEYSPFRNFAADANLGKIKPDWRMLLEKFWKEHSWPTHYPSTYPAWMLQFGYSQRQYIQDLNLYWDNVHAEYGKPWPGTKVGEELYPEVEKIQQLGKAARQEMDRTAAHAKKHHGNGHHGHNQGGKR